jgi:hypothetical protein
MVARVVEVASIALVLVSMATAGDAAAQSYFGAAVCEFPGWNWVPYRADSRRFPFDAASVQLPSSDGVHYVNNIDYSWQMWFSANVQAAAFVFARFDLEANFDFLTLTGQNTVALTGDLDNGGIMTTSVVYPHRGSCGGSDADNYVDLRFTTDYSDTRSGWEMRGIWVRCDLEPPKANASRACTSRPNVEHDGILISEGDAAFFTALLPAG